LNQEDYRKLISGRSRGMGAILLRFFLYIASIFYQLAVHMRNFLYSKGWLKIYQADAIVISVGNITVGGTGKTPLVIWLCKYLQKEKVPCAILTRGYKATQDTRHKTQGQIDEPGILAESCPQARVIVNADRVASANEAVNKISAKVLIMDDGFQHRRLARDFDIVTIDAMRPFGYGKLLPAGLSREPVDSLRRADAVVITRSNQVSESELNKIEEKIQKIKLSIVIARSIHNPVCVKYTEPAEAEIRERNEIMDSYLRRNDSIEQLKGKKVFAFCGIGNPDAFIETVKGLGVNLVGVKIYNDHYRYADEDIVDIRTKAKGLNAELVLTTQKDFSKLPTVKRQARSDIPLGYLAIELKLVRGEDAITRLIKDALAGKMAKN